MSMLVRLRAPLAVFAWLSLIAGRALGEGELSNAEIARLERGQAVIREQTVERDGRRYVGGIAYIVVGAPPSRVLDTLEDVDAYPQFLPATRQVRWLGMARTGETVVQLEQGTALVHARYVVRTRRAQRPDGSAASVLTFWLDTRFPHDIADAQGYFRAEPLGDRTLLTYGAWVDLGSGLLNRLLEGRVQRLSLSTPARVKTCVEALPPFG